MLRDAADGASVCDKNEVVRFQYFKGFFVDLVIDCEYVGVKLERMCAADRAVVFLGLLKTLLLAQSSAKMTLWHHLPRLSCLAAAPNKERCECAHDRASSPRSCLAIRAVAIDLALVPEFGHWRE